MTLGFFVLAAASAVLALAVLNLYLSQRNLFSIQGHYGRVLEAQDGRISRLEEAVFGHGKEA